MAVAENFNTLPINLKSGSLEVRLAENSLEIDAAQALRYKVFYEEMMAKSTIKQNKLKRDIDDFDHYFDHILVFDNKIKGSTREKVIGTYRLNRGQHYNKEKLFYTSNEYDISNLINYKGNILELGRSCVAKDYRTGSTMQLLWSFIAQYVLKYEIKIMFGCASFPGIKAELHKKAFDYLYRNYLAPKDIRPIALKNRYVNMKYKGSVEYSFKEFLSQIPPLIKGYIRLGAFIGDGAVIDYDFNTTDICIVLPTEKIASRYKLHYDRK
jgi:putative hemolysin